MVRVADIQSDLMSLVGKDAWRVSRIHGSMFFLEIGEKRASSYRRDSTIRHFEHGEWHFMFDMVQWRFEKADQVVVACEDEQTTIDQIFESMPLGLIKAASISPVGLDLTIDFDSQMRLKTFSNSEQQEWDQWTLYCPDDRYWSASGRNKLATGHSSESRTEVLE